MQSRQQRPPRPHMQQPRQQPSRPQPPLRAPLLRLLVLCFLAVVVVRAEKEEDAGLRRSHPVLLLNVTLADITPKQYLETFWHNSSFYASFLAKTGDIDVDVPKAWVPSPTTKGAKERTVVTKHPVHTRVPGFGIPSHVKSTKRQRLTEEPVPPSDSPHPILRIVEENVVEGVPFSDKFHVLVDWRARWLPPPPAASAASRLLHHTKPRCRLEVFLHVVFTGRFLLESLVARNSASETGDTLKIWEGMALGRFARAEEEEEAHDAAAAVEVSPAGEEQQQGAPTSKELLGLFSCLKKQGKLGMWITALCTTLVLFVTGKGGLLGGAGLGGIH